MSSVQIQLTNLPFEFWSNNICKAIGNSLGSFKEVNLSYLSIGQTCVANILVILDLREGLVEKIVLHKDGHKHVHALYYQGIPFKCNRCHL